MGFDIIYIVIVICAVGLLSGVGALVVYLKCFHQVAQGTALIRNGASGPSVTFSGFLVYPIIHRVELMDLSVKRIEIDRRGKEGLVCRDNMRADLKVAFFVRVNNTPQAVLQVAQSLGCRRASDPEALIELFDAKFSEALKTVGKKFDFVDLYTERQKFKEEIVEVIGKDLNGYVLEDAAIDFLEQTPVELLNPNNILDSEGIKKITDLTAQQMVLANQIQRTKEKTIVRQDVEAREAVLELQRQQAEAEQKQQREIAATMAREQAEAKKIQHEERLKSERARISTDEEIQIAEENKNRQIVVARKNKERTEAVETERVEKDRQMEVTERERIVTLAQIDKNKAIEVEQKNIQEVIRQRVQVQRVVVEEEEKIKDTHEFATAERSKKVTVIRAETDAQQALVKEIKKAEAARDASVFQAEQTSIEWEAQRKAAEKEAEAKKLLALAKQAEVAAPGMAEVQVMESKAVAIEKQGTAEAVVLEKKALAEAKGTEARALALEKQGLVEANVLQQKALAEAKGIEARAEAIKKQGNSEAEVMELKYVAEAKGIQEKANSMKLLDVVGRDHEEFKLRLAKEKDIELAEIKANIDIAEDRARIVSEALKSAKIEILGGETTFFDKIVSATVAGKSIDRVVESSRSLTSIRDTFFTGDPEVFRDRLRKLVSMVNVSTEDLKNLSVTALLSKMLVGASDSNIQEAIRGMIDNAGSLGLSDKLVGTLLALPTKADRKTDK